MPFPFNDGWPPLPATGRRSLRFYVKEAATANYSDRAYMFAAATGANTIDPLPYVAPGSTAPVHVGTLLRTGSPMGGGRAIQDVAPREFQNPPYTQEAVPPPQIHANSIRVTNLGPVGEALLISFDGTNTHGYLTAPEILGLGNSVTYRNRLEAGICVKRAGTTNVNFVIEAW